MPNWLPYCGQAPVPAEWLARWNFDPVLIAALLLTGFAAFHWRAHLRPRATAAAWGIVTFLYISPFCALGSALFTVRIVHDVILVAALAPMLVAGLKLEQRSIPGSLWVWTAIHALTFWLWHAPPLYEAAMSSDAIFWAMQASLTGTATIWWARIIRAPAPSAAAMLLATMVAMGALGALLTFAHRPLYAVHWLTTQSWGLSAIEDQQIAGIVMWAPASLVYLLAALTILYRSFDQKAAA